MKQTALEKRKAQIIKLIEKSDSFIVLFNRNGGDYVEHSQYEISNGDVILACEVVKHAFLKKCSKGCK